MGTERNKSNKAGPPRIKQNQHDSNRINQNWTESNRITISEMKGFPSVSLRTRRWKVFFSAGQIGNYKVNYDQSNSWILIMWHTFEQLRSESRLLVLTSDYERPSFMILFGHVTLTKKFCNHFERNSWRSIFSSVIQPSYYRACYQNICDFLKLCLHN